ncbi:MAG: apolipoprotein N-acyltransferase [Caulobacterales bacterium]
MAAAFAHPPFGFLPGLLGYAAMLWLVDHADARRPLRAAFAMGWLTGVAYFSVSVWWVSEAFFVDAADQGWMAPFAVILLAGGLALFWGFAALLYRAMAAQGARRVLLFAGALCAFEWLRGHLLTGFPWNLPGETWRAGSAPSQAASLVGAYGLSWITVAAAATPGLWSRTRGALISLGLGAAAMVALYVYGSARLAGAEPARADAPVVRVVQPDTPERPSYDEAAFDDIVRRNLELTVRPAARRPDIVVWSESGLPAALEDYLAPGTWTRAAIERALRPGQTLITGGFRAEPAPQGAKAPNGLWFFNSLVAMRRDPAGLVITARYDKHRLVPFGEYMPLDSLASRVGFKQLVHVGDGFRPGPPPRPIFPAGAPAVQPLICYESLFPDFTREGAIAAGRRPAWIVNISDDAWFGVTSGPWQHLNLASYRAIEEGLPMVRATPTGVSAIIDAYGRVLPGKLLGQGAYGVIDAPLPPALPPTGFHFLGEEPFFLMLLLSIVGVRSAKFATLRRKD